MAVDWPSKRQSRGSGSQERKNAERLKRHSSMTAVAGEAGRYSDQGGSVNFRYSGSDATGIDSSYKEDRSLTKQHHMRLFGDTLLKRGNPFAYPDDFKRETARTKRIEYPDTDFVTPRTTSRRIPRR